MSHASLVADETIYAGTPTVDRSHSISVTDSALLLFKSSPVHAKNFALSMHERAAWGLDTTLIDFWADVVTELARLGRTPRSVG
jgi:hypothetical protein